MLFKISPHLVKLAQKSPAVARQFYPSKREEEDDSEILDPLLEEKYTKVKGLVHKYANRVLILLTLNCAAYCRFCTRRRSVSSVRKGQLTENDLEEMKSYLGKHPEIREIIFSGGDPLTVPKILSFALEKLASLPQIKIVRIGTRLPVSDPKKIDRNLLQILQKVRNKPLYVLIHFEHPDEITSETIRAVQKLRKIGAILLSQSVFLKGVNDSYEILAKLFTRLIEIGVKPYYLYRCDPVKGARHFMVDFKKEIEIATKLRKNLSGLACPLYVIDAPEGSGKIPVPLEFWQFQGKRFWDFDGKLIRV